MPPVPINLKPGIDTQSTAAQLNGAGWGESRNIRFFQGFAQKAGGFEEFAEQVAGAGTPRAARAWAALSGALCLAVASENRVSLYQATAVSNITPRTFPKIVPLQISTVAGSTRISIKDVSDGVEVGDWVRIVAPVTAGGIVLEGPYRITEVPDSDHYVIESAVEAVTSFVDGGNARNFNTTAGSATVLVFLDGHHLAPGEVTRIPDAVTVGGITLLGNYTVDVVDANSFNITAASAATATTSVFENNDNLAITIFSRHAFASSATVVAYADSGTASYAPADSLAPVGVVAGAMPAFSVTDTQVVTVEINAVGNSGTAGVHTFRGTTGTGTRFEFTATVAADGTLAGATPTITLPGAYTVNPTSLTGEPILDVTNGTLVGATVNIGMWPRTVSVTTAGDVDEVSSNPTDTTGGSGTGAQLNIVWDYNGAGQFDLNVEFIALDNWGEWLVINPTGGPIYTWQPALGPSTPAELISTAPMANTFAFVATQQQVLVCCGTVSAASGEFDPMLVRWSDVGDLTEFVAASDNQAGSFRLQQGSRIVAALPLPGQILIWTDTALHVMQYQGLPFVWGFQPIGDKCGLIGPNAMANIGDTVVWMSSNQFYARVGGGVPRIIPCSVWDQVFKNIDPANARQTLCASNSYFGEVAWYVPQTDGTVTKARLQLADGLWDYTTIAAGSTELRTAATDRNVFGAPFGVAPDGVIYREETGTDANGSPLVARLLSGIAMIAEGDQIAQVTHIVPDIKFGLDHGDGPGTVRMTVYIYRTPQAAPRVKGPFSINARTRIIPCRCRGRGLQFEFASDDEGSSWRLGEVRYLAQPDGKGG